MWLTAITLVVLLTSTNGELKTKDRNFCKKHPELAICQKEEAKFDNSWMFQTEPPHVHGQPTTVAPLVPPPNWAKKAINALAKDDVSKQKGLPRFRRDKSTSDEHVATEKEPFEVSLARRKSRLNALNALLTPRDNDDSSTAELIILPSPLQQRKKRATQTQSKKRQHDYIDDEEYEYYLWRKFRREQMRKKGYHSRGSSSYYYPSYGYGSSYRYPSYYYPSYSSGYSYPSYGGNYGGGYGGGSGYGWPSYGGYGQGYGQAFNFGIGSGFNIGLPGLGSGIGIGSGLGINVG
ncbi:hypothetical protein L596_001635 [Steinernema carpocapsae]|uniref:Uncharacterized protein n=1 Tax=Steinernema carpocapsae TaxID=34508 RepID=A0A4U8UPF4_STECR|nr:hypothetical protein L596_001635 [Steinernema carpocapsae]